MSNNSMRLVCDLEEEIAICSRCSKELTDGHYASIKTVKLTILCKECAIIVNDGDCLRPSLFRRIWNSSPICFCDPEKKTLTKTMVQQGAFIVTRCRSTATPEDPFGGHMFCRRCLERWAEQKHHSLNVTCPMCRSHLGLCRDGLWRQRLIQYQPRMGYRWSYMTISHSQRTIKTPLASTIQRGVKKNQGLIRSARRSRKTRQIDRSLKTELHSSISGRLEKIAVVLAQLEPIQGSQGSFSSFGRALSGVLNGDGTPSTAELKELWDIWRRFEGERGGFKRSDRAFRRIHELTRDCVQSAQLLLF